MKAETKALAAICECGGWVMLAVLGHSREADKDSYKEAGKLAGRGFAIQHTTVAEAKLLPSCEHKGFCTTAPHKIRPSEQKVQHSEQVEAAL